MAPRAPRAPQARPRLKAAPGEGSSKRPPPAGRKPVRGRAKPAFPIRVGCVDMGSNAVRMLAAEFTGPRQYTVLAGQRHPLRLGHGVFLTGQLPQRSLDEAVRLLASIRADMAELGVTRIRAVATAAVREARNGGKLLERARREAGLDLEVISGTEEARLVHRAVCSRVPLGRERWILADLGGGSVEVMLADSRGIFWSESQTMGAVRLLEELASGGAPGDFQRLLAEYTATLKIPELTKGGPIAGFIGTGGNVEALARLAGTRPRDGRPASVGLNELRRLIATLSRLSYRQRIEELGLREDRADVILPAAMVFERLCVASGCRRILVPGVGLKEGLLIDLVEDLTAHDRREDRRDKRLRAAALALGRRFFFDEPHGEQVCDLALSLFDQLEELHGLGEDDRRVLLVAALLHDVGAYLSYKRHHRHSHYLISESELPGLAAPELALAASVARFHRKTEPAPRTGLPERELARLARLVSLLRLADALDREHRQRVSTVQATASEENVELIVRGRGDLLLERWALEGKAELFEKSFRRKLKLSFESADGRAAPAQA